MTESRPHTMFVDAEKSPGIEQMLDRVVPWILQSEQGYYCRLLEGHDPQMTIGRWLSTPDSEHSLQKMRLLIADDRIAGGFTGFSGRQLRRRRETDLVDLVRRSQDPRCSDLRRRLKDLMPLFGPVAPGDFYVSKFGISAAFDRSQLFEPLLVECLTRARREGYTRLRIDVDDADEDLCSFLRRQGFETRHEGRAVDAGITYLNMTRPV